MKTILMIREGAVRFKILKEMEIEERFTTLDIVEVKAIGRWLEGLKRLPFFRKGCANDISKKFW